MDKERKKRKEFKAKAFITVGSKHPAADRAAKKGKTLPLHKQAPKTQQEAFARNFYRNELGLSKGKSARLAQFAGQGKLDTRNYGTTAPTTRVQAQMMIKRNKKNR